MEMNGRGFHGDYRFGYQGSEKDNEIVGEGNSYTTEFRQLDPRLGRWFSVDPVFQPWQSPYTSMDNNPIMFNDPLGDYIKNADGTYSLEKGETVGEMYRKMHKDGETKVSYKEFAQLNGLNRKTGLIDGKVITYKTKFIAKSPSIQKDEQTRSNAGDVVVTFSGADIFSDPDDKSTAGEIAGAVSKDAFSEGEGKAKAFSSEFWDNKLNDEAKMDKATQAAYDFIKQNYNKDSKGNAVNNGRIIIYGYSYGGVLAEHLTERLAKDKINVDLLITIDAAAGSKSPDVDREIGDNVLVNINIFQMQLSSVDSRGDFNTSGYDGKAYIVNQQLTSKSINHGNIDELTSAISVKMIKKFLSFSNDAVKKRWNDRFETQTK